MGDTDVGDMGDIDMEIWAIRTSQGYDFIVLFSRSFKHRMSIGCSNESKLKWS
jgi:hypothetical protein